MAPAPDQVDTTAASHHYDLMVNTGHVSLEAAAALIRTMYRERCGSAKPSGTK